MRAIPKIPCLLVAFSLVLIFGWSDSASAIQERPLAQLEAGRGWHTLTFKVEEVPESALVRISRVDNPEVVAMEVKEIEKVLVGYGFNAHYAPKLAQQIAACEDPDEILEELNEDYEDGASVRQMYHNIHRNLDRRQEWRNWRSFRHRKIYYRDFHEIIWIKASLNGKSILRGVRLDKNKTSHNEDLDLASLKPADNRMYVRIRAMQSSRVKVEVVGFYPDPPPTDVPPSGPKYCYRDFDGDGFGVDAGRVTVSAAADCPRVSSSNPFVYVEQNGDCDDGDAAVYPGAPELENDCNYR